MENTMEEIKALGTKIVNHWALTDTRQLGLQACTLAAQLFGEVEALKAKLQKVERERDAAVQVIYSVPTCTNCIHMDECDEVGGRCEGRGYGGDCHEPYDEPHFKWRGLEDTTCD